MKLGKNLRKKLKKFCSTYGYCWFEFTRKGKAYRFWPRRTIVKFLDGLLDLHHQDK